MEEIMSLFDLAEREPVSPQHSGALDVVKLEFAGAERLNWQELFSGFDTLHAITYSSSISFAYRLLAMFDQAEIIFGCDEIMSFSLQEIMAYQLKAIERIRETATKTKTDLISRIENGSLRLFVARSVLSHEKIYLLTATDGRRRVVMGSANMSFSAFGGKQRENICYLDGDQAYDWYWAQYCQLREYSTDQIGKEALLCADAGENLEELPVAQTIRVKKALVIQSAEEVQEEIRFALDVRNLADKFKLAVPKPDKKGKLLISPEKLKIIRRQVVSDQEKEKEAQSQFPQLELFPDEHMARLNGKSLDLAPKREKIAKDVRLFLKYMDGYEKFHGDVVGMQRRYYEFANWFFCSPFMAGMRDIAERYNHEPLPYPVFGVIYGQSKAGKTSFLDTLLLMMIGQKLKLSASNFTRSNIDNLKHAVKGAPIIVDDVTRDRFTQHAVEVIKNEGFGIDEHLVQYPAVAISGNEDLNSIPKAVTRRAVICRVQAGLTNTEMMRGGFVRTVQREIGTAFYREYLRRMMKIVPGLQEMLKDETNESAPDILSESSRVLLSIFEEFSEGSLPHYIRELSLDDYFSEKITGSYAIRAIRGAWKASRESFEILEKTNELRYNAGATYEADRLLKELPETLEAHKAREWIIMDLGVARNFFDLSFKKSWLERFRNKQ